MRRVFSLTPLVSAWLMGFFALIMQFYPPSATLLPLQGGAYIVAPKGESVRLSGNNQKKKLCRNS